MGMSTCGDRAVGVAVVWGSLDEELLTHVGLDTAPGVGENVRLLCDSSREDQGTVQEHIPSPQGGK